MHKVDELGEVERLVAVGKSLFGIGVDFDDEAVGADGFGGEGEGFDEGGFAGAVAGVDYYWEVAKFFD